MIKALERLKQRLVIDHHQLKNGGKFRFGDLYFTVPPGTSRRIRFQLATNEYESAEIKLTERYVPTNLPVIELGGCLGVVSAHLRRQLQPEQPLIIVEANPELADTCLANATRARPGASTTLVQGAIHYGEDHVAFRKDRNIHGNHRLMEAGEDSYLVKAYRLQDVVARLAPGSMFSLVSDIEGAEYDIVEHDGDALERCAVMIVETHPDVFAKSNRTYEGFLALAQKRGFTVLERIADVVVLTRSAVN